MPEPSSELEKQFTEAASRMFGEKTVLDRTGRPIAFAEAMWLANQPDYIHIARTRVTDRMPPYFDIDVSTVWLIEPRHTLSSDVPLHFETMLRPRSACLQETALTNPFWGYTNPNDAAKGHELITQHVAALLGDPVMIPKRAGGKKRDTKPWRGMSARRRAEAQRGIPPRSSGEQWVRGRRGQPGMLVMWTWNSDENFFDVVRLPDTPASDAGMLPGSGTRKQLR